MASASQSISLRISANGAEAVREMQRFGHSVGNVKERIDHTAHATTALTASLARMGHFSASVLGLRELGQAADAVKEIEARGRTANSVIEIGSNCAVPVYEYPSQPGSLSFAVPLHRRRAALAEFPAPPP